MENDDGAPIAGAVETVNLQIKFGSQTIKLSMLSDSIITDLKILLKNSTNVLPRGQKLIHKGKVLVDSDTLKSSDIKNGSKIMLIASQDLHQGEGPKLRGVPVRSNYQKIITADNSIKLVPVKEIQPPVFESRIKRWRATGIVAITDSNLKKIPDEVWECGLLPPSDWPARMLDLSNNHIRDIPIKISCMTRLQKLILKANEISDDSISWEGLTHLKGLKYLSLDQNNLTCLSSALGELTFLEQLHVAGNKLESLPIEIGLLIRLEILNVNNNRISAIPSSIGDCSALIEVDISSNLLEELPETFGNLQNLMALHLRNNGLKSLPSTLFKKCIRLSTIDIHKTEITTELLYQIEGWEDFDKRRKLKHQKQLDFRAGSSGKFDEGADKD